MTEVTLARGQLGEETEAEVVQWLVAEGEHVSAGQPIAELATAKVVFEIAAPQAGLLHQAVAAGGLIPAGGTIAVIKDD